MVHLPVAVLHDNIPAIPPEGCRRPVQLKMLWGTQHGLLEEVQEWGNVPGWKCPHPSTCKGMVLVVAPEEAEALVGVLKAEGETL